MKVYWNNIPTIFNKLIPNINKRINFNPKKLWNKKPISIYPVTALNGEYLLSQFELNRWNIVIPDKYKEQVKFIE